MVESPCLSFNPELVNTDQLHWHQLTGPAFEEALCGKLDNNYKLVERAWLQQPDLYYYRPACGFSRREDTRVFFMATLPCEPNDYTPSARRKAVAMLEIDFEYESTTTVGIKYVTVHEACRQFGLAKKAYEMLIRHLNTNGLRLYRTKPGRYTPPEFTESVTKLLNEHNVDWFYRNY